MIEIAIGVAIWSLIGVAVLYCIWKATKLFSKWFIISPLLLPLILGLIIGIAVTYLTITGNA